jgi:NitT/TauT family transport system ATP-binding protein
MIFNQYAPVVQNSTLYPGVTATLLPGTVTAVMGASGCGKTSLFRAIRNETPSVGVVSVNSSEVFSVFQTSDQLFDWYTIEKNLNLVCVTSWMSLVKQWGLESFICRYPHELSIGQLQRFTLIRALCSGKSLLLCDEPLSAVDGISAIHIAKDFYKIVHEQQLSALWITHNALEASVVADQVMVISPSLVHIMDDFTHESILKSF